MKHGLLFTLAIGFLATGFTQSASAAGIASLQDWCFNVNGDVADLCNGGASPALTGTVNGLGVSGNLDLTLGATDPNYPTTAASNNLGSASFVVGGGQTAYVNAYMDYDLNYNAEGSNSDFAVVHGALPAGFSYEVDDPNSSNILCGVSCFGDVGANTLNNQNNVATFATTQDNAPCCDVSWALGVTVSVAQGFEDTITFLSSTDAPTSGFYIEQRNGFDGSQVIYLSASISEVQVGPSSGVPEPGTFLLLGTGFAGLIGWRVRARRQTAA